MEKARNWKGENTTQERLIALCKRRGFFWPSFEIYGGSAGFYDYGPLGVLLRNNILSAWRKCYRREGFFEIDTPSINPADIFRASGHEASFSDILIECESCHETYRADHLLDMQGLSPTLENVARMLNREKIRCIRCGSSDFGTPRPFNLMFTTAIGPSGQRAAYLRPETAQGIFINFRSLLSFFRDKLPFGIMHTGRGFRNEISPRQGLIRLREFNMMEVEIFLEPDRKTWPAFSSVRGKMLHLLTREGLDIEMEAGDAVLKGVISSEALAYFMVLTAGFMGSVGVDPARMRFRQHMNDELAHYSVDTWDCEAFVSGEWIEITGIADRGDYDLKAHARFTGKDLSYFRRGDASRSSVRRVVKARRAALGPIYRENAKGIADLIERLSPDDIGDDGTLQVKFNDREMRITPDYFSIVEEEVDGERTVPHVIEPSSGLDRIFYTVLEHSFREREYSVLTLPATVAPLKAGIFPLTGEFSLCDSAYRIYNELLSLGMDVYYDDTGSIGRRYARMDEIGTPYCVTVDEISEKDGSVTVRERDSRRQIRVPQAELHDVIASLLHGADFEHFRNIYAKFNREI